MKFQNTSMSVFNTSDEPTSYLSNLLITIGVVIFFIFSFIGNLVTLVTIKSNSHLQNITNTFIASLCVSDLISTVLCSPLWLYRKTWGYSGWRWSNFLCKLYWVSDFTTNYVTALHIASFAAFRFAVVRKPFKVWDIPKGQLVYYILSLWVFSLMIASPLTIFMDVRDMNKQKGNFGGLWPSCSIINEENCCVRQFRIYSDVVYPLMFFLPMAFVVVCSFLLMKKLIDQNKKFSLANKRRILKSTNFQVKFKVNPASTSGTTDSSESNLNRNKVGRKPKKSSSLFNLKSKEKKVSTRQMRTSLQLVLVVSSFMFGYIPTAIHLFRKTSEHHQPLLNYWFGIGSYFCLRFSECLNPVMYNLGSHKLRKGTKRLFQKIRKRISFEQQ